MREIKLRAWLQDKAEMYYQDQNTASRMMGLERFVQVVGDEKGYTPDIMQWTGVADIYEGDIVCGYTEWGFGMAKMTGVVIFQEGCFKVRGQVKGNTDGAERCFPLFEMEGLKVVGNRCENADLL